MANANRQTNLTGRTQTIAVVLMQTLIDSEKMTKTGKNEPYKEQTPQAENNTGSMNVQNWAKYAFGIFMVIIYIGMGYLMFVNFFGWGEDYTWARYSLGSLFVLYGFWRAYRQIKIAR